MTDHTPKPNLAILNTLASIAGHHKKRYCYPSQSKIRQLHARHTGQKISGATLNRHLRALENAQLIHRQHRHRQDRDRGWLFRSTLYTFTQRANRLLTSLGKSLRIWAAQARKRLAVVPCLKNEKQFMSLHTIKPVVAPSRGPPTGNQEVALRACDTMRLALLKK